MRTDNDVKRHEVWWGVNGPKYDTSTASPRENIEASSLENIIESHDKVGVDTFLKRTFLENSGHEQRRLHALSMIRRYYLQGTFGLSMKLR